MSCDATCIYPVRTLPGGWPGRAVAVAAGGRAARRVAEDFRAVALIGCPGHLCRLPCDSPMERSLCDKAEDVRFGEGGAEKLLERGFIR